MEGKSGFGAFIGIDWGDRQHHVVVWDVEQNARTERTVEQTPEALHAWIGGLEKRFATSRVAIAIEQSRGAVFYALMSYAFIDLYPINPKSLARYRDAFRPSGAKDDPTDADFLVDLLRNHRDRLRPWKPDDVGMRTLRLLVEDRRSLVGQRTSLVNQVTSRLKQYFPQALEWAGGIETLQACDFLERWPTLEKLQTARPSQLRTFFREHTSPLPADRIEQRIAAIRKALELVTDEAVVASSVMLVLAIVAQLRAVATGINEYDRRIAKLFAGHDDAFIFESFPGAGRRIAPRLLVAFGSDRDRFATALEVAQWSGIAPVLKRSGSTTIVQARRACPIFVRQTFHEFARLSVSYSPWAAAFFDQQLAKGMEPNAIFRTLAYRWIRILFVCWKTRERYDEARYIEQLRRRGSPLTKKIAA